MFITNADGSGEGLNDSSPVAPVGGNPGTTLGEQRLNAFQYAADIWGTLIDSAVPIEISAEFNSLPGNAYSAVLGSAGVDRVYRDFPSAPQPDTWYTPALTDALEGSDQGGGPDIVAQFNSAVDGDTVLGTVHWYYGFDGAAGGDIDFVSTALHEIAHGLGFLTFVSQNGSRFLGRDDAYMLWLEDHSTGKLFPAMSDAERASAMLSGADLHFAGPQVVAASGAPGGCVDPSGHVEMYAPSPYQSGSSVSHFSTACSPDEVMEPYATGALHDVGTALPLFFDLGWPPPCGNGVIESGELCDDGNGAGGDGCSASCQVEQCYSCDGAEPTSCAPLTGDACDDGIACTDDVCDAGTCVGSWDAVACALDHFKLYKARTAKGSSRFTELTVNLVDQFEDKDTEVRKVDFLGNPADKESEGVNVPEISLQCYKIKDAKTLPAQAKFVRRRVQTVNQFGTETLDVIKPTRLCLPSAADEAVRPSPLWPNQVDHFKCYKVRTASGTAKFVSRTVSLADRFESKQTSVEKPAEICNPVDKEGEGISRPDDHLECYKIKDTKAEPGWTKFARTDIFIDNQFGRQKVTAVKPALLCVPSSKTEL